MFEIRCREYHNRLYLSTTHNGYQWTSIPIENPEIEIPQIVDALQHYLPTISNGRDNTGGEPESLFDLHKSEMFRFQSDTDVVNALLELADNGVPTQFMMTLDGIVQAAKVLHRCTAAPDLLIEEQRE